MNGATSLLPPCDFEVWYSTEKGD